MADIKIEFKDGTKREFKHERRAGGSYTKRLTYEGAFIVIEDEWGRRHSFPAHDIREVTETPTRF